MQRSIQKLIQVLLIGAITSTFGFAADPTIKGIAEVQQQPVYMGRSLDHWLISIRNRDSEMERAISAVRTLGPDAQAAVPELTQIVAEPFAPVRIGVDDRNLIAAKLRNLQLRADAIDALAAIGEAALPSSVTLLQWAFSVRVVPGRTPNVEDDDLFVGLVAMDVLERMRVAGAIANFGRGALPVIAALLTSPDGEDRKLAVAILDVNTLPIVTDLLTSKDCNERKLGLAILVDMWPVVPRDHLLELKSKHLCNSN
jgi:hypothetical protein